MPLARVIYNERVGYWFGGRAQGRLAVDEHIDCVQIKPNI